MRATTLLLAACLLAGAAVGCSSERSQDEIAADCRPALSSEATKTDRPKECEGLTQENYDALLMHWILEQQGVLDKDGNVDLDGVTATP